jgi:hypothetical protein
MVRFEITKDAEGWTILDNLSGMAVIANAKTQSGLSFNNASVDAELMNILHANQRQAIGVVLARETA